MNIYLVRHGETDWNGKLLFQGQSDTQLNNNGMRQAKKTASALKHKKITLLLSSDLKRAFDTAGIIKKELGLKGPVISHAVFRERYYGSLEGKHYTNSIKPGSFDGEKDPEFFSRVEKAIKKILKAAGKKHKSVCVVTHGGFIRVLAAVILGLTGKKYKKIRLYNASISGLHYSAKNGAFYLTLLNSVSHLSRPEQRKAEFYIKGV